MMIKRAVTGHIEDVLDEKDSDQAKSDFSLDWNDVVIKDVLDVPTHSDLSIDVDLDDDEEDAIAVRV